jgi:hypothetical protein
MPNPRGSSWEMRVKGNWINSVGWSFRKSVAFGPLRLNFSKSGVGASVGVRGARVSFSPRGTYINMGSHGIYYRKRIDVATKDGGRPTTVQPKYVATPPTAMRPGEIRSADVGKLVETSSQQILADINQRARLFAYAPLVWTIGAVCTVAAVAVSLSRLGEKGPSVAVIAFGVGLVGTTVVALPTATRDARKRMTPLFYELADPAEKRFNEIRQACASLAQSHRIWRIRSAERQTDWKRHAGASTSVERETARAGKMNAPYIATNVEIRGIDCGSTKLFFFPDRLFVFEDGAYGAVSYESLIIETAEARFIEDGWVPRDATIDGYKWQYVRRDGGPDQRFANNRQLPVALYGHSTIVSPQGLNIHIEVSNVGAAFLFAERLSAAKGIAYSNAGVRTNQNHQDDPSMSPRRREALEFLAVDPSASGEEIKAAYHRMVQMYHPDKVATLAPEFRELAHRRMKEINAAYSLLSGDNEINSKSAPSCHQAARFRCPHCNAKLSAPTGYDGHAVKCPACKQPVTIPHLDPPVPPAFGFQAGWPDEAASTRFYSSVLSFLVVACSTFDGWVKRAAGEGNDIIYRFFQVMLYVGLPAAIVLVLFFNR